MSDLAIQLHWQRAEAALKTGSYSNAHTVQYNSRYDLPVDAAPDWGGDPANTNPEQALAGALEELDRDAHCRAIVLGSTGTSFCAGADFSGVTQGQPGPDSAAIYGAALRLFATRKPIVAALQGAAVGAGAGLALVADFRIATPGSRFSVNFNRLGFHPGFGLSITLPRLVGVQAAARLFYLGERINGERMLSLGLVDALVPEAELLGHATTLARQIAVSSPQAVQSTRDTLRLGWADEVRAAIDRELSIQLPQFASEDFREGVAAAAQRRDPVFRDH